MKIRGERECRNCGNRWSYYETGSVTCPSCGSMRSVGVDDHTEHTDNPATLDLSDARAALDGPEETTEAATAAADAAGEYVRTRGFIHGGEMQPLDATFVAAVDLRLVGKELARSLRVEDEEQLYFLSLLRGADAGERPPNAEVPPSLVPIRGLVAATATDHYRRDLKRYLDDHPDPDARTVMGSLLDHKKRIEALDGDVPLETSDSLLQAVTDLSHYVAYDDESALDSARGRFDDLGS